MDDLTSQQNEPSASRAYRMTANRRVTTSAEMPPLMPGDRVEVVLRGTVQLTTDERLELVLDDGSTWWFLPRVAEVRRV